MSLLRYISHPEVVIDPDVPVPEWPLTAHGRRRVVALLDQPWIGSIDRIATSAEIKAIETATIFGEHPGLAPEVRPATGEVDRRCTGYVTHERHEQLADALFARPGESAGGWEQAIDVQQRVTDALADVLVDGGGGDVAVVGHGGAGTLVWCHLAGQPIDRRLDQPGPGHYFTFDRSAVHPWRPIDRIEAG
ncbi:MAG: phosphoglycerate mutase family protein [Acidimicrobiia bacterium]|nr:phosphoglycerate mutase family protein [Acidimicrobiia bacterium]MDH5236349.1 phosphoglycerate mutase family protein [Acidimicrobiia bacterium]